jgi:hypothetical protein
VNSIIINQNNRKQAFAGTDWGLYYTDNITVGSPTWLHFTDGLPNTMIWDLAIDRGATTLAVFTRGRGAFAIPLPTTSATAQTYFFDDFDTPPQPKPWTVTPAPGPPPPPCIWNEITSDSHSPTHSWTTHPYGDNCNTNFTSPAFSIPAGADSVNLSFWEHHDSESGANGGAGCPCDFGNVQMSVDGGAFQTISGLYDGTTPPVWTQSTVALPDSVAGHSVQLRFHFQSDGSVSDPVHQGWYIDDVKVTAEPSSGPTSVKVAIFSARRAGDAVAISWRTASEANALGYNVWRFVRARGVKVNRTLVSAKGRTGGAAYRLVDRTARPGVAYTYRLQIVGKDGRRTWSARTALRATS